MKKKRVLLLLPICLSFICLIALVLNFIGHDFFYWGIYDRGAPILSLDYTSADSRITYGYSPDAPQRHDIDMAQEWAESLNDQEWQKYLRPSDPTLSFSGWFINWRYHFRCTSKIDCDLSIY